MKANILLERLSSSQIDTNLYWHKYSQILDTNRALIIKNIRWIASRSRPWPDGTGS